MVMWGIRNYELSVMQSYVMIVLDSCVVIQILRFNLKNIPVLLKNKNSTIILMDTVLGEIKKVYWSKKKKNISYVDIIEKMIFFGSSVSVFQTNEMMEKYAKTIESKYEICHYPDSLILAAAKFHKSSIVTFDNNMLKVAKHENISTYDLKKLKDLRNLA